VVNLPLDVDNELITALFGEFGEIERIVLSKNLPTAVELLSGLLHEIRLDALDGTEA